MSDDLSLWTIYDHPAEYPEGFVARRFVYDQLTSDALVAHDLETLRAYFIDRGMVALHRDPSDDPKIVETWL